MNLKGKIAVVTGGASGIGKALCQRFADEGAEGVVVADMDAGGARNVAEEVGGLAQATDVSKEAEVNALVDAAVRRYGRIDLFCSNAGVGGFTAGLDTPNDLWQKFWDVNVMAHVYAARAVIPAMVERGEGYLLNTASAAGLLTHLDSAPYAVTKHGAVAFAEWVSVNYGDAGIRVSCLCPLGVNTKMLLGPDGQRKTFMREGAIEPEAVAQCVIEGLADERFLILPHPEVEELFRRKGGDHARWLRGTRRLKARVGG